AQVVPQAIPDGALVIVPRPVPAVVTESVTGCESNVAVIAVEPARLNVQDPDPEHTPPPQPVKAEPRSAIAETLRVVPPGKVLEHVVPQTMPAGALVTVPPPLPALLTVRETSCSAKVAVTVLAVLRSTVQPPLPEQPPLQFAKVDPGAAFAERLTLVPPGKVLEHVAPQAIPGGVLVIVPSPVPALLTVKVTGWRAKLAVTVVVAATATMQVVVEHPAPLQPVNVEPEAGEAERVTDVPLG